MQVILSTTFGDKILQMCLIQKRKIKGGKEGVFSQQLLYFFLNYDFQ